MIRKEEIIGEGGKKIEVIEGKDNVRRIIISRKDSNVPASHAPIDKKQMSVDVLIGGLLADDADLENMGLCNAVTNEKEVAVVV